MAEEKQKLQRGKSFVTVVGKAKVNENTFSGVKVSDKTGYNYVRINLGIETAEGNVVYGEMMGGFQPSNPVIYAMNKEDNSALQVNWADRLNDAIVSSVADFKLHKVGLERKETGDLDVKSFLSPVDVEEYLKKHLKDGMEISVRGQFEFSEYRDETQRKFKIQNIYLPFQAKEKDENDQETGKLLPVQYRANFTQTVLLTEDSFKKITKADAEAGEVIVQAKVAEYVNKKGNVEIKKNMTFPLPIVVKINKEKPEMTEKILNALFKVGKGKVRELGVEGYIVEGYEKQDITTKDVELSDEIKELIAMGLYSEEEAKQKMTVRGNKVSKLVFTRPVINKDDKNPNGKIDLDDAKYAPQDLYVPIPEANENPLEGLEDQGSATESSDAGDLSWMSALNV